MDKGYTLSCMKAGVAFDWDDANVGHLTRHRVRPAEAEQVFRGAPLLWNARKKGVRYDKT